MLSVPAAAQDSDTKTDYYAGYLEVTAEGTSKVTGNRVQMELLAVEGARLLAEVKLAKAITGVRVTGMTKIEDMIVSDSRYANYVKATIKGAVAVKEAVKWVRDANSKMGESPRATVVLRMCFKANSPACSKGGGQTRGLFTDFRPEDLVPNAEKVPLRKEPVPEQQTKQSTEQPKTAARSGDNKSSNDAAAGNKTQNMASAETKKEPAKTIDKSMKPYTGLIVNLTDIPYLPVLAPQIHSVKGGSIYDPRLVKSRYAIKYGYAEFVNSLDNAKKLERLGDNPLIVEADDVSRDNHILVTEKVADAIARANKTGGDFLRQAKVAVVVQN